MLAAMDGAIRASEMPMASQTLRLRCSFSGPAPAGSPAGPVSLPVVSLLAAMLRTSCERLCLLMMRQAAGHKISNYGFSPARPPRRSPRGAGRPGAAWRDTAHPARVLEL